MTIERPMLPPPIGSPSFAKLSLLSPEPSIAPNRVAIVGDSIPPIGSPSESNFQAANLPVEAHGKPEIPPIDGISAASLNDSSKALGTSSASHGQPTGANRPVLSRRVFMSALSSATLVPALAAATTAPEQIDRKLIALGRELDIAAAEENALWAESERLSKVFDWPRHRRIVKYRSRNAIDREIVQLLGERNWQEGSIFAPVDIENLKLLEKNEKAAINNRVQALIKESDRCNAFISQPHIVEVQRLTQEANERSSKIVEAIEAETARTLQGLFVKMKAVRWCRVGDLSDEEIAHAATDTRLLQSILVDIEGIAKRAAA